MKIKGFCKGVSNQFILMWVFFLFSIGRVRRNSAAPLADLCLINPAQKLQAPELLH